MSGKQTQDDLEEKERALLDQNRRDFTKLPFINEKHEELRILAQGLPPLRLGELPLPQGVPALRLDELPLPPDLPALHLNATS